MRTRAAALALAVIAALASQGVASGKSGKKDDAKKQDTAFKGKDTSKLQMYKVVVDAKDIDALRRQGFDPVAQNAAADGKVELDLVLSDSQKARLEGKGFHAVVARSASGETQRQLAAAQSQFGFNVWRSYDEPGGIRDELYDVAAQNKKLVKLVVLGHTEQNREIVALKVTKDATKEKDGKRPAVLYSSLQHAREWISVEVNRRNLHYLIDQYNAKNKDVRKLLDHNELWFVIVSNPDGYEYTFTTDRMWRKNLRDNDGDNVITNADGVDPNRNYPNHWNYDDEGSSSQFSSETYRGTAPASEPETQAMISLYNRVPSFKFQVNYHSYGPLLLYSQGWQVETPSTDDPIFVALTGDDNEPAIPDTNPGVGADLYTTNGETTDYAHNDRGILAWTPELEEGCEGCAFVFPDDEDLIQAQWEKQFPFAWDVAASAKHPDDPVSHLGRSTEGLYTDMSQFDAWKSFNPLSDLTFDYSYGDPQPVTVLAKRSLKHKVELRYSINGKKAKKQKTTEWDGGERFGDTGDRYYHYMRGMVTGTKPGDSVKVWFESGKEKTDPFTYLAEKESDADVLVVSAEDYSGASPAQVPNNAPHFLSYYTDALSANGISYEVYDVDAHNRIAPDDLGVLDHFKSVIWYTGEDFLTREPGQPGGTGSSTLANTEMLEMRSYINEGGTLVYTGKYAGKQYAQGFEYNPLGTPPYCDSGDPDTVDGCLLLSNDFLQYYLGAYIYNEGAGLDSGVPLPIDGLSAPYGGGLGWDVAGGDGANNQAIVTSLSPPTASFITTSSLLPVGTYPQFSSTAVAEWDRAGPNQFEPFDGTQYMYSKQADISYKRLMRTINVGGGGGTLKFRFSYDTEADWDFVFVEAHIVGDPDWDTLPDVNGHTSNDPGLSCPEGWQELHPFLAHYQTDNGTDTCDPVGSTGPWNASSGRSDGWEEWNVNLTPYAGKQIELSISYVSDWATQGLGAWVDKIEVTGGAGTTSFESGLDGWTVPGAAPDSDPNPNDWTRTLSVGYHEGAVTRTADSLYMGFGFEGVSTAAERNELMDRSVGIFIP